MTRIMSCTVFQCVGNNNSTPERLKQNVYLVIILHIHCTNLSYGHIVLMVKCSLINNFMMDF